ncbi:PREDICTED: disease resistance protein TAO1-like isoform X2 [Nelumbo nucifera]|uniref:Disease resistance protein TAO1-like isoform X2 n=1 Tax=Nelumbo nucifera TaxID=4432 RepID=A0A1U7ZQL0_NELNU|nr:PREDICTED: disease resistance protein TAO1-like isoform X2 [Nelumbo nucifera]
MLSRIKNWVLVRSDSNVLESVGSSSRSGLPNELLLPEEIRGRVVLYDVFISHRGSDGKIYARKIHESLKRLGVKSFLDTEGILKGENLSAVIVEAINSCTVFLVILSKGFAESAWCLEELRLMLNKVKEEGNSAVLLPVFYGVEPDDLRDIRHGPFSKAFQMHKKGKEFSSELIRKWEEALKEVANVLGPRLSDFEGKEKLLKSVVKDIIRKVKNVDLETPKFPVVVDERVHELDILVKNAKSLNATPSIVGIIGMTGIGKTTVAKQYFNMFQSSFTSACFIDGIKQKARSIGLPSIQQMLLKELVLLDVDIHDIRYGVKLLKKRLQGAEVLIVLDDVDDVVQLQALMVQEVLSPQSVILITTTNCTLLIDFPNIWLYRINKLDRCNSRKLLLMHAMKKPELIHPELDVLVEQYLDICDGIPLSLEVIGRSLSGINSKHYWKNTLEKVSNRLPEEITRRFMLFFETLNQVEKDMLVDIACFFMNERSHFATSFWDACGISGADVLKDLILKDAIIFDGGIISMNSLMKVFILKVVDEENKRDRQHIKHCWKPTDVHKALQHIYGFTDIEYLNLVAEKTELSSLPNFNDVYKFTMTSNKYVNNFVNAWPAECFNKMDKLKLLLLENDCISGDIRMLPERILWLQWQSFPYHCLPLEFPISSLRVLKLDGSRLSSLWDTSEPSKLPLQLRHLYLEGCPNLGSLPATIGSLMNLQTVFLTDCKSITSLPDEICNCQSLYCLEMSRCSALEFLPPNIGNLKNLKMLILSGCSEIQRLPESIGELVNLNYLFLDGCQKLITLPYSFANLTQLKHLDLSGCSHLHLQLTASSKDAEAIDQLSDISEMKDLEELKLQVNGFTKLPDSCGQLSSLTVLYLQGPHLMELPYSLELPEEIGELCNLETLCIRNCRSLTKLPSSINHLSRLLKLELEGNSNLHVSHESFLNLSLLNKLVLGACVILDYCFSMIPNYLLSLTNMKLQGLQMSLIKFPEYALPNIVSLSIVSCNSLIEVTILPKLRVLEIVSCLQLRIVYIPRATMWLRNLKLRQCPELSVIQSIDMLRHLEKIDTVGCVNLNYIQGLELVRTLKEIHIFITYWGFRYHGDEWLQKLQNYIYAPAMHFATKSVINKHEIFKNFKKMNQTSNHKLTFELPESTVPYAWVIIAFLSHDSYEDIKNLMISLHDMKRNASGETDAPLQREGNIVLSLDDGSTTMLPVHEYPAAEVGETLHFSIFSGNFWLCEQLKSGRVINVSSNSYHISLKSGWVRMLSIEEESNIEAIQRNFFEELRKDKEEALSIVAECEDSFYSTLLKMRMENCQREVLPLLVDAIEVPNSLDMKINTQLIASQSMAEMKDFEALDIANCRIMRTHILVELPIWSEFIAPTYKKEQALFLQDCRPSLSILHLEISKACRRVVENVVTDSHVTIIQVTIGENYEIPGIINHTYLQILNSEEQGEYKENPSRDLQVVLYHHDDLEYMKRVDEEIELRKYMGPRIQFFADDDNGVGIFLPDISSSDDDSDDDDGGGSY